jgi:rubrerythrin
MKKTAQRSPKSSEEKNPATSSPPPEPMQTTPLEELLYQALETEIGGVEVYQNAIRCALNPDLKNEWLEYLEQTQNHERILRAMFQEMGLDAERETPGRHIVRHHGRSMVHAMAMALKDAPPEAAELVAAECVVLAETKDHQNWELLGELLKSGDVELTDELQEAYEEIEEQEDEHLYHSIGWARELWLSSLGLPAVLPPPEERADAKSAIEAAQAKEEREGMAQP